MILSKIKTENACECFAIPSTSIWGKNNNNKTLKSKPNNQS